MKQIQWSFILLFLAVVISCKDENPKSYKPSSIGAVNSLAVVMETSLWQGEVGDKIREHFASPVLGLTWDEPLFSIEQIPPSVFSGTTRHRRAVLYVQQDTLDIAHVKTDMYAMPQKIGVIKGRTEEEIIENLDAKADEIISAFKQMELEVSQRNFLKSLNKEKALQEKFGITLDLPSIYRVDKQEENFVWIAREIQKGNMNIIVYTMPSTSFNNDSTLVKDIVRMRDSIGEKYVPGPDVPDKITYMRTEPAFSPYVFPVEIGGKKAVEVRGIWDVKNYPMAGPFLTYIINDKANDRILVLEGFTFAPATSKRDDMFQLEAIMKTVKINTE